MDSTDARESYSRLLKGLRQINGLPGRKPDFQSINIDQCVQ